MTRPWWCRCDRYRPTCACPRWTPGALSHDFGGRERGSALPVYTERIAGNTTSAVACYWPPRWRAVAVEILDLPITVRTEPVDISGEFRTHETLALTAALP